MIQMFHTPGMPGALAESAAGQPPALRGELPGSWQGQVERPGGGGGQAAGRGRW